MKIEIINTMSRFVFAPFVLQNKLSIEDYHLTQEENLLVRKKIIKVIARLPVTF